MLTSYLNWLIFDIFTYLSNFPPVTNKGATFLLST